MRPKAEWLLIQPIRARGIIVKYNPAQSAISISNRFFENQPNEICSHLSEKASKNRFRKPEKLQNHRNKGKRKEKEKERGEEKKSNGCTLSFHNGYSEDTSWPKTTVGCKKSIWR